MAESTNSSEAGRGPDANTGKYESITINNLPERLGFPESSPKLTELREKLAQSALGETVDVNAVRKIAQEYEAAAADLVRDWPPLRKTAAAIGAFVSKANALAPTKQTGLQEEALTNAWILANTRRHNLAAGIIDQAKDDLLKENH